jgi:sulfur carrier protein
MQILVNGDTVELQEGATLIDLLAQLSLQDAKVAIELNQDIVPRSQHAQQRLTHQDQVEIVHAIGGG